MENIEIVLDIDTLEIFQVIRHDCTPVDEIVNEQLTLFETI
ncbi:hypothetical protein HMPREF9318_00110 [Streptococcus urinalis FB127-CNA-2]|uniref:Uncharacterized protein n=1 Tax=Streptococcus urinalis 2285-97 TaxID=764291 RepID=G5KEL5_9STRE|nr:hypothetical protein [Streptococcus agalactiae]EHJ55677.1 hypothetical protein STRUR_0850 [Streptococcus urinalis 2285-97]EKS21912.1 hypothetical protein HMPREF9318_00110 [Streptococcus urinalis FB127-CNA-2]VEF31725.1 Uncharacterised protein [Streptococcus urinalis]